MHRRQLLVALAALAGATTLPSMDALAGPVRRSVRRTTRRRVRRRVRRRIRRRTAWRVVAGRRLLVVPVAMAVGWELVVDNQPVTVVHITVDGSDEVVTVKDANGQTQTLVVVREDTPENSQELEGTILPDGDTTTPGRDDEIEVEVEE